MRLILTLSLGLATLICVLTGAPDKVHAYTGTLQIPAEGVTQIITLEDGSSLVGTITEIRADQIKFQTELGEIAIAVDKIQSIKETKKETAEVQQVENISSTSTEPSEKNPNWFPNPNRTRLLI